jgi:hypothetical protein
MSDTAEFVEQIEIEAPNPPVEGAPEQETPAPKPPRVKKIVEERDCLCRVFRLIDLLDKDTEFDTECESTTKSVFAQGHDAKLVSWLVKGQSDGYTPVRIDGEEGARIQYENAGHAAASVSEALGAKADIALQNAAERETAKALAKVESAKRREEKKAETAARKVAEKAAAAAAPRPVKVKVVPGSDTKRQPQRPSDPRDNEVPIEIKVGRTEISALSDGTDVRWIDSKGKEQTRPLDTVRVLVPQA